MSSITEAGETIHIAKSGRLILKIQRGVVLKSGESLIDNTGRKIGRVNELIGPVDAPYASVLLDNDEISKTKGTKLFYHSFSKEQSRKSRKKRRSFRSKRRRYSHNGDKGRPFLYDA